MRLLKKMKENRGSAYFDGIIIFLIIMIIVGVYVEYMRIINLIETSKEAFSRANITLANENYDEIYSSVREQNILGGDFEGGNEGELGDDSVPEFFYEEDYGEIMKEMQILLGMIAVDGVKITRFSEDGKEQFSLYDFKSEIKNVDKNIDGIYEAYGSMKIQIPFYFLGKKVTEMEFDIISKTKWNNKL